MIDNDLKWVIPILWELAKEKHISYMEAERLKGSLECPNPVCRDILCRIAAIRKRLEELRGY